MTKNDLFNYAFEKLNDPQKGERFKEDFGDKIYIGMIMAVCIMLYMIC